MHLVHLNQLSPSPPLNMSKGIDTVTLQQKTQQSHAKMINP